MAKRPGTKRLISYSEITQALSCTAAWDMRYGNVLAGSSLKRKVVAPKLSAGRVWGIAVAAWHAHSNQAPAKANMLAHQALEDALSLQVSELREQGLPADLGVRAAERERLGEILEHYTYTAEPLGNLTRLEGEIRVPVPSRTGVRVSNRYDFQCFIDGYTVDRHGLQWIVEFKLRDELTPFEQLERDRQSRWYAWALRQSQGGHGPIGVIIEERVSYPPNMPNIVWARNRKSRVPSTDKSQRTIVPMYRAACAEYEVEPDPELLDALTARRWQQRVPFIYQPEELNEAGRDLVSAARRIHALDSGREDPIRNARPQLCNGCFARPVCANPSDRLYVETLYDRRPPKRERLPEAVAA